MRGFVSFIRNFRPKPFFSGFGGVGVGGGGGNRASALNGLYGSENPRRVSNYGLGTGSRLGGLGSGSRLGGLGNRAGANRLSGGGGGLDDYGLGLDGGYGNGLFEIERKN